MSSTVFPWKMLAITTSTVVVLSVGGFLISGRQPVKSQQTVHHTYITAVKATTVVKAPSITDSSKSNSAKTIIAVNKKSKAASHRKKVIADSYNVAVLKDTSSASQTANKADVPVAATVDNGPTPLNEMLVMDITAPKKSGKDEVNEAHPKSGWDSFDRYLKMEAVSADDKAGTVNLSFIVHADGTLSGFKIKNSLSSVADKKAIYLIKNGCAWAANANRQAKEIDLAVEFHKL